MGFTSNELLDILAKSHDLADLLRRGRDAATELVRENEELKARLEDYRRSDGQVTLGSREVIDELSRRREENEHLRAELVALDSEYQRFAHRCVEVEAQNEALANLYVANCQLHTSLEPESVTHAIQDIVEGLIGASQWALFERDAETGDFVLKAGEGVASRFPSGRIRAGDGPEGRVVDSGEPSIGGSEFADEQVALLPLTVEGECIGLIAIYRMLAHKRNGYSPIDYELLNLLSGQAATALASSRLFAARLRTVQPI